MTGEQVKKYSKAEQAFYDLALEAKCNEDKEMQESIHIALEALLKFNDAWGKEEW